MANRREDVRVMQDWLSHPNVQNKVNTLHGTTPPQSEKAAGLIRSQRLVNPQMI